MKNIDDLVNPITFKYDKSKNPIIGDTYYDMNHECVSIYDVVKWNSMYTIDNYQKIKKREETIDKLLGKENK